MRWPARSMKSIAVYLFLSVSIFLSNSRSVQAGVNEWQSIGPYGGTIHSLAASPNFESDRTLFAGTYNGLYKSSDAGASWSDADSGILYPSIKAIAFSPDYASDQTIFAAAENTGVYKSTDGGATWLAINDGISFPAYVKSFAISPVFSVDHTIYAGTDNALYKSVDGGMNWNAVNNGLSSQNIRALAVSPAYAVDQIVYAGTLTGLFKSNDGGVSWNVINNSIENARNIAVSPGYTTDQTIFVGTYGQGLYKSINGGISWEVINDGLDPYALSLVISPDYITDHTLFAGTYNGVFKSTDKGTSWSRVASAPNGELEAFSLALSPGFAADQTIFTGIFRDGLLISTNGGDVWSPANNGIKEGVLSLAFSPDYPIDQIIYAVTEYDGAVKSIDGGLSWSRISNNNVQKLAVSPAFSSDHTLFAGTYNSGMFKSTNGGESLTAINNGICGLNIWSLVVSPTYATDRTIYAGTEANGVCKSTDGGLNWSAVNSGLSNFQIRSLAISPTYTSDQTVFAVTADGIYKSTNGGSGWNLVTNGLTNREFLRIVVSPGFSTDQTIFAGTSIGLIKSINAGTSWSADHNGMDSSENRGLAISPNYAFDKTIYAATSSGGVFKSMDGGISWSALNSGISTQYFFALDVSPGYATDQTVFAGGSDGLFKLKSASSSSSAIYLAPAGHDFGRVYMNSTPVVKTVGIHNTGGENLVVSSITLTGADSAIFTVSSGTCSSLTPTLAPGSGCTMNVSFAPDSVGPKNAVLQILSNDQVNPSAHLPLSGIGELSAYADLSIKITGSGGGAVEVLPSPPGTNCAGNCSQPFLLGTVVTITPGPETDSTFDGWTGCDYVTGPTCTVAMHTGRTVTATFNVRSREQWIGNGPDGGQIRKIVIDPTSPTTVYAGAFGGGIFKSNDSGESWSRSNNGLTNTFVNDLAIDPVTPSILYAGTSAGLFKSMDGGNSWYPINIGLTPNSNYFLTVAIDPATPSTIYTLTYEAILKSTDSGNSWNPIKNGLTAYARSLAINPKTPSILYAGTDGSGVFKSTNGGNSWIQINNGLTTLYTSALSVNPAIPSTLYVTTYNGVYRSTDSGASWSHVDSPSEDCAIAVDPAAPATLYGCGNYSGFYKSTNGGDSWASIMPTRSKINAIAINPVVPSIIYAGTEGLGVIKSIDSGESWNMTNNGLRNASVNILAVNSATSATLYAGTVAGVFISTDNGHSWSDNAWRQATRNFSVDFSVNALVINPDNPSILFAGTSFTNGGNIFGSTDGGNSWSPLISSIRPVKSMGFNPANPSIIYAATAGEGIYRSMDGGNSWSPINNGMKGGFNVVNALAINPSTPAILYAGSAYDGIYRSVNGGNSWSQINSGLTSTNITAFVIDPQSPATIYAGTYDRGMFKSTNGGDSWIQVNNGLTNARIGSLAIDPEAPNTIYVGIYNDGVLRSTDGGNSWSWINSGLTSRLMRNFAIVPSAPSIIYAGTDGGGLFRLGNSTSTPDFSVFPTHMDFGSVATASQSAIQTISIMNTGETTLQVNTISTTGVDANQFAISAGTCNSLTPTIAKGGNCKINIAFTPTSMGGMNALLQIASNSATNPSLKIPLSGVGVSELLPLSIDLIGAGYGSISYSTGGSCSGGCSSSFAVGTAVSMTPSADADSSFAGWTGCDTVQGSVCTVSIRSARKVIATFIANDNARWISHGPYGGTTRILAIAPSHPSTIYAATDNYIFKSLDSGGSWAQIRTISSFPRLLIVHPTNPDVIYLEYGEGLFITINGGQSWSQFNSGLINSYSVHTLAMDPVRPNIIYAGTSGGIFKSIDDGASWSQTGNILAGVSVTHLAIDPATPSTIYAGTSAGAYKSTDSGISWNEINNGLALSGYFPSFSALAISPSNPSTVYAAKQDCIVTTNGGMSCPAGVFRSTDAGNSWTRIPYSLVTAMAINPEISTTLYIAGSFGIQESTDGGDSWRTLLSDVYANALIINPATPSTIYAGTFDRGIYKSSDSGNSWKMTNEGVIDELSVTSISINPLLPSTIFALATNGIYRSTNSGDSWTMLNTYAASLAIDPGNPSIIYAADNSGYGMYRSRDGGETWSQINLYLTDKQISALTINPASPNTLFLGTFNGKIFKSTNGGDSWKQVGSNYFNFPYLPAVNILAVNPVTPSIVYVVTGQSSIIKSADGGDNWLPLSSLSHISSLLINPQNPNILYAGTHADGVYRSTDGGGTWAQINNGLTSTSISALTIDPANSSILYAGTTIGIVFRSIDSGSSWRQVSRGLPEHPVSALAVGPGNPAAVYAGTLGLFRLSTAAISVSPATHSFGSIVIGNSSQAKTITISNTGSTTLTINSMAITGGESAMFHLLSGSCPSLTPTLVAGASCTVNVDFTPASAGGKSATLSISSSDPVMPNINVSLAGSGVIPQQLLSVTLTGDGSGAVSSSASSPDLRCFSGTCSQSYPPGTVVTLSATPAFGFVFSGWSGACSGTGECKIIMDAGKVVTAGFSKTLPMLPQDDFETGNLLWLPWNTGGDGTWSVKPGIGRNGTYGVEAPVSIVGNQLSYVEFQTNMTTSGTIAFWYKVSSETNFDFLRFKIDGIEQGRWSGDVDWTQSLFFLPKGNHTLRWEYVKDESVSSGSDTAWLDEIKVTLATDTTAPIVTSFTMPPAATSLTVPVSSFTAVDNMTVSGYLITESPLPPSVTAPGWSSTAPTSFTFLAPGNCYAYAWVKDTSGNVSANLVAMVGITLSGSTDTIAPIVTSFSLPSTNALNVPVTTFAVTDNIGVVGYLISENGTDPLTSDPGWSSTPPANYTFTGYGSKTLYAWAKDGAGNISARVAATCLLMDPSQQLETVLIGWPAHPSNMSPSTFAFTANRPNATFECSLDSQNYFSCASPVSFGALANGSHTFTARAKDINGNYDETPASYTWTVSVPIARINLSGYASIAEAYENSSDGHSVDIMGIEFEENMIFNRPVAISLKGGFDPGYLSNSGTSTIHGNMTIVNGTVTVENITIM